MPLGRLVSSWSTECRFLNRIATVIRSCRTTFVLEDRDQAIVMASKQRKGENTLELAM